VMVSSSCSTSDKGRVILVMVSSSYSTSDRVRVPLVMVSSSYSSSGRDRVTLVMVTVPALLVTEVVLFLLWKVVYRNYLPSQE
jgi:hypothetical protein